MEAAMAVGPNFGVRKVLRLAGDLSFVMACLVFIDFIELICLTKFVFRFTFTWHAM